MPVFASRSVFVVGRTAPALLTQTPNQGDMLVYDAQLGVFVNMPAIGGAGSAISVNNTGAGYQLANTGQNALNVKSLVAGNNITLSDNGQAITINSTGGSGPTNNIGLLYMPLSYDSGTTNLITIPAGGVILNTEIAVMSPFDGSPTFSIGTSTTPNLLVDNSNVDLTNSISYKNDITFVIPGVGDQVIQAFMTPNGATQGMLSVFIEYSATSSIVPVQNASVVDTISDLNNLVPAIGQFAYVLDNGSGHAALYLWIGSSWMLITTD